MNGFLIDTNIIIDVLKNDPVWRSWSASTLARCADSGTLVINPIIYAELAVGFSNMSDLDSALPSTLWERRPLSWEASYLAGQAFREYRQRGGPRTSTLPDLYIGAHAAVDGLVIVTRDPARMRTCFPSVQLITP